MLYRLIIAMLWPFLMLARLAKGESRRDLAERLGRAGGVGPVLWLHGASNGEVASARWLVERLREARPDLAVLVTCNTLTARAMVRGWDMPGVTAALAPVDTGFAIAGFLKRWRPLALISLEGELWPNRFAACGAADVPIVMLGARMSARSFAVWQRFGGLAAASLAAVRFASAQDAGSRQRLSDLGLPPAALGPEFDLKAEAMAHLPAPDMLPRAQRAGWLLAASTHDGEDEAILDAFVASGLQHLILAPRHASRGDALAGLLTRRGLTFRRRSQGGGPGEAPVLLADTMGEMDLWYERCGICLIGGTLVDKGGHTPWEPARHGCALLHGPSLWNFSGPFAALDAAGAALPVTAQTLAAALATLDGAVQDRMAVAAKDVLQAKGDATVLFQSILRHSHLPLTAGKLAL